MNRTRAADVSGFGLRNQRNRITSALEGNMSLGLYGSTQASLLIKDAIQGKDSLDIVTIGDSNTGFSYGGSGGCGGGYTRGWLRALNNLGAPTYATPLMPTTVTNTVTTSTQLYRDDDGSTIAPLAGYFSNVPAPTGSVTLGSTNGPGGLTTSVVPATAFKPYGLGSWNYAFIANGSSAQTFSQLNGTYPGGSSPSPALPTWCAPGTAVKYRVVYATQNGQTSTSTRARFNPTVYRVDAGNYVSLATQAVDTYSASGITITSTDLAFTMPSSPANQAVIFGWNYIGFAYGPCSVLWDCVYKTAKGVAVNNLHYGGGQSPSTIADIITGSNSTEGTFMLEYFKQIIARQVAAGGTGRVIISINYGINPASGPDSGSVWTSKTGGVITFIQSQWAAAGGTANNLAFVVSVTHPLDTYGAATETALQAQRNAANVWAATQPNTTVVDISQLYTPSQMTSNGYYAGAGSGGTNNESHLSQAGYYAVTNKFVTLLSQV